MMGYYKRPDLTSEVIEEGWFHTGDIGVLVDQKFLKITNHDLPKHRGKICCTSTNRK